MIKLLQVRDVKNHLSEAVAILPAEFVSKERAGRDAHAKATRRSSPEIFLARSTAPLPTSIRRY
jgi:hypothetical protein